MMSVPLLHDEEALGVLNVLDRRERSFSSVEEMDLLGVFANQAAIAISVVRAGKRAKRMLEHGAGDAAVVADSPRRSTRSRGPSAPPRRSSWRRWKLIRTDLSASVRLRTPVEHSEAAGL